MNRDTGQPPASAAAGPPASRNEVAIERIQLTTTSMRRLPWVHGVLILCMAAFMYRFVELWAFCGWAVAVIVVEVARSMFLQRTARRGLDIHPHRVHAILVAQAVIAGGLIGLGAVLFLPQLPVTRQALYGGILFVIPAASAIVSQSSRYIVGAYAIAILLPATATWTRLHPALAGVLAVLTLLYILVLVSAAADGDKLLARSLTIRHERDQLIRDLEQRNAEVKSAVLRAEEAARTRARVLASASHDLRQPLHALSVYSAVLATHPPPEAMEELSSNIDHIVQSLGNLLNGLLDLSKISAGHFTVERKPVALDKLVAGACKEFESDARARGLAFDVHLEPVVVMGDPMALGRIVRNLLDNALKYTGQGGIEVSIRRDNHDALLRVRDTGRGVATQDRERIFEEFYQGDSPGRDRSKGVGLGLAIVRRLCELSGGKVWVESVVGEGATFIVQLPLISAAALDANRPAARTGKQLASLRGLRVYVLDDDPDITHSMQQLLAAWGIESHTSRSTAEAERLFRNRGSPHLLITDLRLGAGEDGATFAARMRRERGIFPVCILTGDTATAALQEARRLGFTIIYKPVSAEPFRATIAGLMAAQGRAGGAADATAVHRVPGTAYTRPVAQHRLPERRG